MATGSKPRDTVDRDIRLLRLSEVAERLSVSKSFAHKLVACGQLRALRLGRAVRVRPRDLEAYLEDAARAE